LLRQLIFSASYSLKSANKLLHLSVRWSTDKQNSNVLRRYGQ